MKELVDLFPVEKEGVFYTESENWGVELVEGSRARMLRKNLVSGHTERSECTLRQDDLYDMVRSYGMEQSWFWANIS